jgi:hypothetical protein
MNKEVQAAFSVQIPTIRGEYRLLYHDGHEKGYDGLHVWKEFKCYSIKTFYLKQTELRKRGYIEI